MSLKGGQAFGHMLAVNTMLQTLEYVPSTLHNSTCCARGLTSLLLNNCSLTGNPKLGIEGAAALARGSCTGGLRHLKLNAVDLSVRELQGNYGKASKRKQQCIQLNTTDLRHINPVLQATLTHVTTLMLP